MTPLTWGVCAEGAPEGRQRPLLSTAVKILVRKGQLKILLSVSGFLDYATWRPDDRALGRLDKRALASERARSPIIIARHLLLEMGQQQQYRPVELVTAKDDAINPDSLPPGSQFAHALLLMGLATVATTVAWVASTSAGYKKAASPNANISKPVETTLAAAAASAASADQFDDRMTRARLCPPVAKTSASSYLIFFSGHSGSSAFAEELTTYEFASRSVRTAGFEPLEKHNATAA